MNIFILSRSEHLYSTRKLAEAALARGHDARIVDYLQCSVVIEKGKPIIEYQGKRILPNRGDIHMIAGNNGDFGNSEEVLTVDAIIPRIGSSKTFYGAAIVRQFEMMKVFTTAKSIAIVRARDKLRSLQILAKAGVDMPKTVFASRPTDVKSLIAHIGGPPVVLKILEGTQGIGVVLAESRKAARSVIEAFHSLKANILLQEYIKESRASDIRVLVVDGKVVAAMKRQGVTGEFRSNLHRGGTAVPIILSQVEKDTALSAARALGLSIAGVDMLQSNRGPLVLEVNSSPGLEGIEKATGIDVAGKIVRFIEKQAKRDNHPADKIGA